MTLKTLCTREVLIAYRHDSIVDAAKRMREYHAGDVVVVEERNGSRYPIGIVTDRDIVIEVVAKTIAAEMVTVGDLLCRELVLAKEEDNIFTALDKMRQHGVRRLPVVDDQGVLAGIITIDDVVEAIAEQLSDVAGVIGKEQKLEKKDR